MRKHDLDAYIVAARPEGATSANSVFTDKVMAAVTANERFSAVFRKTSVIKKETLLMKIRHLPKIAIVAIAIGALLFVTGTTYAVLQTVTHLTQVKVNQSGANEFGREQLTVEFDSCDAQKKEGTTYELKRGSNLSADDGQKVLQARCDMDIITSWLQGDARAIEQTGGSRHAARLLSSLSTADTVKDIQGNRLILERREKLLPDDVRVVENGKEVGLDAIKPGDTVIYFVPAQYKDLYDANNASDARGAIIFKLPLDVRYYSLEFRSYVHARSACHGNSTRTCLQSNGINHTILTVAHGGGMPSMGDPRMPKEVQGRVVSYDAGSVRLDVGDGVIYTIQTPHNVIDDYNRTTVYGLASFDRIYAKTSPEDLMIKPGDSLEIHYLEPENETSPALLWDQITVVSLMVERTVKDLDVLQKY